jgi:hypothetical protein
MADEPTTTTVEEPTLAPDTATDLAPGETPVAQPAASKDAEAPESPVNAEVNTEAVPAQVTGPPSEAVTEVPVHETHVVTDRVITDPSDPLAVQVPPEGRGNSLTPIGRTFVDGSETPEESLARKAKEAEDEQS